MGETKGIGLGGMPPPNVRFHWVEGAGHQAQIDKPYECADIIRELMRA